MIDWESQSKEWKEKYPRVMKWDDVPDERRVTPEIILDIRGEYGRNEANNLCNHTCEMATDYGSRWGKRFGIYTRCGISPNTGEKLCPKHGGAKKEKPIRKTQFEKRLEKKRAELNKAISERERRILVLTEELKHYKEEIKLTEQSIAAIARAKGDS